MLARFERAVIAEDPQSGDLAGPAPIRCCVTVRSMRARTICSRALRSSSRGAWMSVLMIPQYVPRVLAKADHEAVVTQIASVAKEQKIGLLHRYDMMRHLHETDHLAFETFVTATACT